jgi:hypothetical protein
MIAESKHKITVRLRQPRFTVMFLPCPPLKEDNRGGKTTRCDLIEKEKDNKRRTDTRRGTNKWRNDNKRRKDNRRMNENRQENDNSATNVRQMMNLQQPLRAIFTAA